MSSVCKHRWLLDTEVPKEVQVLKRFQNGTWKRFRWFKCLDCGEIKAEPVDG